MERAQRRKFHYLYRITNKLNDKFYIGIHSTDNLDDGYFGSGKYLKRSIERHGKNNHEMQILEFHESRDSLKQKEAEIVNEELLSHPLCMNLTLGGGDGWHFCNSSKEEIEKRCWQWVKAHSEKMAADPDYKKRVGESMSAAVKRRIDRGEKLFGDKPGFLGNQHSEETKQKMRKSKNAKEQNSQFGLRWIHNLELKVSKRIKNDEALPSGWNEGRKIKF